MPLRVTILDSFILATPETVEFQSWKPGWFHINRMLCRCALCSRTAARWVGMGSASGPQHPWGSRREPLPILPSLPHFLLVFPEGRQGKRWMKEGRRRAASNGVGATTALLGGILSYGNGFRIKLEIQALPLQVFRPYGHNCRSFVVHLLLSGWTHHTPHRTASMCKENQVIFLIEK